MSAKQKPQLYRWKVHHPDHEPASVIASSEASAVIEACALWQEPDWGRILMDANCIKMGKYAPPVNPWA